MNVSDYENYVDLMSKMSPDFIFYFVPHWDRKAFQNFTYRIYCSK